MAGYEDFFKPITDFLQPVTNFIDSNEKLINLGVTGATAIYGYQQQQQSIDAQEAASARALSLQTAQYNSELQANRLAAPNEAATINMISNMSSSSGSINDFLYDRNSQADTTSAGLGLGDFEKKLNLV
jgi:hypothetical protein